MQRRHDPDERAFRLVLLLIAVIAGGAFVALALIVAPGPLDVDITVADTLRPLRFGLTGAVIAAVNLLGQALVWDALLAVLAAVLWLRGRAFDGLLLLGGVLLAEAGASLAKIVVSRGRPPGIEVADLITQASYPSGHMTRTVVTVGLFVAMAWSRPSWRIPAVVAAVVFSVLMGVARVAVGEHWFTDIVGATLNGIAALAVIALVAAFMRKPFERRFRRG